MKRYFLIFSFIVLLFLTSCKVADFQAADLIEAPENNQPPLSGKWVVTKLVDGPYKRDNPGIDEDISNTEALFSEKAVMVGKDYTLNPSYKIRNVDIDEYLFYNYKIDRAYLDIPEEDIYILTVVGEDGYFNEFIKYDKDKIIFFEDEKFIFFQRQVETISSEEVIRYIDVEKSIDISSNLDSTYTLNTGLLLGVKTESRDEVTNLKSWDYSTVWIRTSNREISSVYKINGLLLPRKKGFWHVDSNRQKINENVRDIVVAEQKGKFKEESINTRMSPIEEFFSKNAAGEYLSLLKHILFIGNDYVSLEEINPATNRKNLRVYPIDYLEEDNPTMLSDLLNLEEYFKSSKTNLKLENNDILEEESFGIDRKNGHWMLKARLNYSENKEELYKDFDIKVIPPKEIVQYDELAISWSLIKARFPQAVDAFTSPNEDIILIITREDIEIYPIRDGDILSDKLGNIEIDANQKLIMAEWGMGKYTNLWETEVLKNNAQELEY